MSIAEDLFPPPLSGWHSPLFIVDSREPFSSRYRWPGIETATLKLPYGDYALLAHPQDAVVERKTVADLAASIIQPRFWKELDRAKEAQCKFFAVVIEGIPDDLSRLRSAVKPAAVLGACTKITDAYKFRVQWAGDRARAAEFTKNFLLTALESLSVGA